MNKKIENAQLYQDVFGRQPDDKTLEAFEQAGLTSLSLSSSLHMSRIPAAVRLDMDALMPYQICPSSMIMVNRALSFLLDIMRSNNHPTLIEHAEELRRIWAERSYTLFKKILEKHSSSGELYEFSYICRYLLVASLGSDLFFPYERDVEEAIRGAMAAYQQRTAKDPRTIHRWVIINFLHYWMCLEGDGCLGIYEAFDAIPSKVQRDILISIAQYDYLSSDDTAGFKRRVVHIVEKSKPGHPLYDTFVRMCFSLLQA